MNTMPLLRRLAAFTDDPAGGNPAGVWLGSELPDPCEMLSIAAEVGYSETAFLAPDGEGEGGYTVRYYSPKAEVSFCGHATIASGVLLGTLHGPGTYRLETAVGRVPVEVSRVGERLYASLTSVEPRQADPSSDLLTKALEALGWSAPELDPAIPPMVAWAGAWHLVLAVTDRSTLDALDYEYAALESLMLDADLTTLQLIWREDARTFHARNPFPVGGVVEDPATGAAAAALGGYLRDAGLLDAPASFVIHQGVAMGRPSRIEVRVPVTGGITVAGTAVALDE
jgi:PhzF family phenazine biosynthesis protein